jgi:8-oxo-dGTP diphosphatase
MLCAMSGSVRERACGVVVTEGSILLVRHVHDERDYWTLPGGGIEQGETAYEAAKREVLEETSIDTEPIRMLFTYEDETAKSHGILMAAPPGLVEPKIGDDPEQSHIPPSERMLRDVAWHPLDSVSEHFPEPVSSAILEATGT